MFCDCLIKYTRKNFPQSIKLLKTSSVATVVDLLKNSPNFRNEIVHGKKSKAVKNTTQTYQARIKIFIPICGKISY